MDTSRKRYFYCRSLHHSLEPMNWPRIKENGFDLNIKREDLPFFITFFRELHSYYADRASWVPESYQRYMDEIAQFFKEQSNEMIYCSSIQTEAKSYVIPFTDFVAAFMLADEAFERIFKESKQMEHHSRKCSRTISASIYLPMRTKRSLFSITYQNLFTITINKGSYRCCTIHGKITRQSKQLLVCM
ncbi:hypothetical protein JCM19037_16 [Geomicrobium sp. JCM 19037]|uniref:hypothetical protein n=1 Tax=Geomicrobium sp. JCM 19037 TaxID=1460634 RepID=UPI00045F14F5|nr:hypothetical protein [Geomicrobium sp. JCM 19037]GAK01829.1 hypothetical protein JCM19037_16 [Geomicrobium sp. JCM 19037]